jgi:hypothetical protein
MGLHVLSDGALGRGRLPVAGVSGWLTSHVSCPHLVLSLGRDLAATVRDSIRRRASRRAAPRIHVPPMTDAWLRIHEADCGKRPAEL